MTIRFDAARLSVGTDTFEVSLSQNGQRMRVGLQVNELKKDGARFVLTQKVAAVAFGLEGTLSVWFGPGLEPLERVDHGSMQGAAFSGAVSVKNGRVTGTIQSPAATITTAQVDAVAAADLMLEEGVLFALLPTVDLVEGQKGTFSVIDDQSGKVIPYVISVEGKESIEVPAGRFDVFRVRAQAKEATMIYVSATAPHRVVRINPGTSPIELRLVK